MTTEEARVALEAASDGGAPEGTSNADAPILRLPAFEGPLDLLLHLIEKQDLDITAVSLLAVTEQYLAHLRAAGTVNVGALADFIAVGARLLLLKSRALLPREDQGDDEDAEAEAADPEALVAALQEYRRYKRAAEHLRALEEEHRTTYRREAPPPEIPLPTGLDRVTLDALAGVFRAVLERMPAEEERPAVERDPVRLRDRISRLVELLEATRTVSFRELIESDRSRVEVVVDFLAVLELIKARYVRAVQDDTFADIALERIEGASAVRATTPDGQFSLETDFADT